MLKKHIYALYLPQYHCIPENDKWWGKGYTEWNAVRKAKPLYCNHNQPNIPLNDNYYDLSDETGKTWKWQAELAKENGVEGFCIYHYWFKDGKQLLQKPMEILLEHKEIEIKYFICWANEPWRRTWYGNNYEMLMDQTYGDKLQWKKHFEYLKQFFLDNRYLKIDNKPVIAIYKTKSIEKLNSMRTLWDELARQIGFSGVYIMGAKTAFKQEDRLGIVDGEYLFEPAYSMHYQYSLWMNCARALSRAYRKISNSVLRNKMLEQKENMKWLYKSIQIPQYSAAKEIFYGICPSWDNTPRKQNKGCVFINASPNIFEKKLREIMLSSKGGNIVMINAWNEWGEGAYLEPDVEHGNAYLTAVKKAQQGEV